MILLWGDVHTYAVEYRVCKWVSVHCPYPYGYSVQNPAICFQFFHHSACSAASAVIAVAGNGDIVASTGHVDEAGGRLSWLCTVLY